MIKEFDYNSEFFNERADECLIEEELVNDLKDTLQNLPDRTYLCANEIGVNKRMFAIRFDTDILIFVNPVYQDRGEFELIRETEPSTSKEFILPRCKEITLCYQDDKGETKATKFNEDASPVISQAMDCLDGIHAYDYGLEIIPEFDEATDEERMEVIKMYLNSLKDLELEFDKDLSEDEETKRIWKSFKFRKAVADGEVQLDDTPSPTLNRKERRLISKLTGKFKKKGKKSYVS